MKSLQLHRCTICNTRWLLWPDACDGALWNLLDQHQRPGACCDNAPMGSQVEFLRDLPCSNSAPSSAEPPGVQLKFVPMCKCGGAGTKTCVCPKVPDELIDKAITAELADVGETTPAQIACHIHRSDLSWTNGQWIDTQQRARKRLEAKVEVGEIDRHPNGHFAVKPAPAMTNPCAHCHRPQQDHYAVNFSDGPSISGTTLICPSAVFQPAPAGETPVINPLADKLYRDISLVRSLVESRGYGTDADKPAMLAKLKLWEGMAMQLREAGETPAEPTTEPRVWISQGPRGVTRSDLLAALAKLPAEPEAL